MPITRRISLLLLSPLGLALLAGLLIPMGILLAYSFFTFELLEAQPGFHLDSYKEVFTDPVYRKFAANTLWIALPTTALSVVGGYIAAYYLVLVARPRARMLGLALIVISMLASYLARIYAWRTLMGEQGVINSLLQDLGLTDEPAGLLLFSRTAAVIAQTNYLLPFSALLFASSMAGIDPELRQSARDLGAGAAQTFRRITLPLTGKAVLAAVSVTFFLSAADYITPGLVGGANASTFGVAIATQLTQSTNYPLGAATSFAMVLGFVAFFLLARAALRLARLLPAEA
jgi:spermidine/putrescine transport system permease protein